MFKPVSKTGIFAAALVTLVSTSFVIAGSAQAATHNKPVSDQKIELDRNTTGSVNNGLQQKFCDPLRSDANIVCKITGGNPEAKFPSAPITNFGF